MGISTTPINVVQVVQVAVEAGVIPPATFMIVSTAASVCISISVDGGEFHVVLVVQSRGGSTRKTRNLEKSCFKLYKKKKKNFIV